MKNTLLLRCQAPLQAWGVQSLFSVRDSCREPTKSGIIGLLCAALGRGRNEPPDDLAALRMGIRVDREGALSKDFQTARGVLKSDGTGLGNIISDRFYLSDAIFLVGLEGEDLNLLEQCQQALRHPQWLLFLGRRAFPPSKPVWLHDGLRNGIGLEEALMNYPALLDEKAFQRTEQMRFVFENSDGSILQNDRPVSFAGRIFLQRAQSVYYFPRPAAILQEASDVS